MAVVELFYGCEKAILQRMDNTCTPLTVIIINSIKKETPNNQQLDSEGLD